jgi:hypothetical protein
MAGGDTEHLLNHAQFEWQRAGWLRSEIAAAYAEAQRLYESYAALLENVKAKVANATVIER